MSAFGTKRTSNPPLRMSAFGGKADIRDARLRRGAASQSVHIMRHFSSPRAGPVNTGLDSFS